MWLNSSLMFKNSLRVFTALLTLITACLSLCSCSSKAVYRIDSISWVSGESASVITNYTYTKDNKPATINTIYYTGYREDCEEIYSYDKKGNMVSCTRIYNSTLKEEYTAKKITKNKYILYDTDEKEYLTIIFDDIGFIVSNRYTSGYVTEYAFTNDESGKPTSFKQLDIHPSGSQRIIDYTVEFQDDNTFRMYATGEYENRDEYYEVKYQKIIVKG